MMSLLFLILSAVIATYMLLIVLFTNAVARVCGDFVDPGQLDTRRVRYASYLLASPWRAPTRTLRIFKALLRTMIVAINISFYTMLYLFAVEGNRADDLTWYDVDPRGMSVIFWLDYAFKVTTLLSVSLAATLVARNDAEGMDASEVIEASRWRMGVRLIFQDVCLPDYFSRVLQGAARWSILFAILSGIGAILFRLS